jgi:2',3'-cyclic-nucleotide 2'-phosphodiesterase/3'-nucleotidase
MRLLLSRLAVAVGVAGLAILPLHGTAPDTPERARVTILATTDLHGRVFPINYGTNQPSADGLARVATLVRAARKEAPDLLLVDCGDTIQGTPLAYYHNRINNEPVDPMMLAMNALGYTSMTLGNHEYNFGLPVLHKARGEARFPWLSANTLRSGTDEPAFTPYVVREVAGVRVGILGLTTPAIPSWENPAHFAGLAFIDPVASARRWVEVLRTQERVDVVVAAVHFGINQNLADGRVPPGEMPNENPALPLAQTVPGIDLMFLAHTHTNIAGLSVNGVLISQAGRWGDRLARADVFLERPDRSSRWRILAKASTTLPISLTTTPDPEILDLVRPYHEATQTWLSQPVGRSAIALSSREARLRDSAIIDLIHRVQLDAGKADISFAAAFTLDATLPAGDVTVRDLAALYIYENTLAVVELTGAEVKDALEHAAGYFRAYQPGLTPAELVDPVIPGYNFDTAEGVEYTLDLRRPRGDRVVDLRFGGAPIDLNRRFRVAINNYRLNGGGGYRMFRNARVVDQANQEIRELMIDWVRRNPEISSVPTGNWRLLP